MTKRAIKLCCETGVQGRTGLYETSVLCHYVSWYRCDCCTVYCPVKEGPYCCATMCPGTGVTAVQFTVLCNTVLCPCESRTHY